MPSFMKRIKYAVASDVYFALVGPYLIKMKQSEIEIIHNMKLYLIRDLRMTIMR